MDELRRRLFDAGTGSLAAVLRAHLPEGDVEPSLALLVGGVLARGSFQAVPPSRAFVEDLVDRVLASSGRLDPA